MDESGTVEYASWGQRVGAFLLDLLVACVAPGLVVGLVALAIVGFDDNPTTDDPAAWGAFGGVVTLPLVPVYFWICHGMARGQTVGKRVVGIAVRLSDGNRLGYPRAAARTFPFFALWILFFPFAVLDSLWPLWDEQRQALHDKVGSIVVRVD